MEFGNFGYTDEITGEGWQAERIGWESEIPKRHWHLNDPGVVPTTLITGAGSPTGILVYEGRLLPKAFWDQVIHCDAGPNVVRAYPARAEGLAIRLKFWISSLVKRITGFVPQMLVWLPMDRYSSPIGMIQVSEAITWWTWSEGDSFGSLLQDLDIRFRNSTTVHRKVRLQLCKAPIMPLATKLG